MNLIPTNCVIINIIPVGAINPISSCPNINALTTTSLLQLTLSAKGANGGIDKTAKPDCD